MIVMLAYIIGFFLITLLIHSIQRKRGSKSVIWRRTHTVLALCILGVVCKDINYFAAIIGYILADKIGR